MTLSLTHSPLHPHCRKVRILLGERHLDFVLQDEPFWEQNDDFLDLNPSGEVPVLQDEEGFIIAGHYAISEYLEERAEHAGGISFLGKTLETRAETRRLVDWFDNKFFCEVTQTLVYEKYFKKLEGNGWPDTKAFREAVTNIHYHLEMIEALTQYQPWLNGEHSTLADFSAAAQLSVIDYFDDVPWSKHKGARDWYRLVKSRPSMRPILQERVRGLLPPNHYDNPDF